MTFREFLGMTAYHGSPIVGLRDFKAGPGGKWQRVAGVYFSKTRKAVEKYGKNGQIYQVELRFENPADRQVLDKLGYKLDGEQMRDELIRLGYDGVVDDYMDEIVVFYPHKQIISTEK